MDWVSEKGHMSNYEFRSDRSKCLYPRQDVVTEVSRQVSALLLENVTNHSAVENGSRA